MFETIWDVLRHLVENGPFASDAHRQSALNAIERYVNPSSAGAPDQHPSADPHPDPQTEQ